MTTDAKTPIQTYVISGTGPYALPWPYGAGDVKASVVQAGLETVLTGTSQFTVSPASADSSGNLTLSAAAAATYAGKTLRIRRATPIEQGWAAQRGAREVGMEVSLDTLARGLQDANAADKALRIDLAEITSLSGYAEALAEVAATAGLTVLELTGDGVTLAYTLPSTPSSKNAVEVVVEGATQIQRDFTLAGAVVTLSEPVPAGVRFDIKVRTEFPYGTVDGAHVFLEPGESLNDFLRDYVALSFLTVADMIASVARIDSIVATRGGVRVLVFGGRFVGDGGFADMLIVPVTGLETTVVQNGLTLAPGYEIILSASSKATWPRKIINAVTVGARNMTNATETQSVAANDALLTRMDELLSNDFTMAFPPGTYWHKEKYANLNDKDSCAVIGAGIGVTVFNQADWLDGSGDPQYDDGAGGPNPLIQSQPFIQFYDGSHNRIADMTYRANWMRIRGFWMRSRYGVIERCLVQETCGRAFAASNAADVEWDTLDPTFGDMVIRDCIAIRSIGTAFSMFGNMRGALLNNVVQKCWAEGLTTDASDYVILRGNYIEDVCRFDDQAGYPPAGLWDGESGNGGIGAVGAASCSFVTIDGNIFNGIGLDDPTNAARDRPFIRWRPRKRDHEGLVVSDNQFINGHVGVHVEALWNLDDVGYTGLHVGKLATITGNTFRNVRTSTGQGHVRVDEGCTYITVKDNQADVWPLKIFGAHDITAVDTEGSVYNGSKYISTTCELQIPTVAWSRKKRDEGADLAEQLNVTGNGTYVTVKYPSLEPKSVNAPAYGTGGNFTAPYDGLYALTAGVELNNLGTATSGLIEIQVNAIAQARKKYVFPSGAADTSMALTTIVFMQAGDLFRVQVMASGAGADTVDLFARPLTSEFTGKLIS